MTAELIAHLRTLPDDWSSWLVYADALIEAGDPRGQLLVIEHQLATAPEPALQQRADEIAAAWLAEAQLPPDDSYHLTWLPTLTPLARRGSAVYGVGRGQLLALLEPGVDLEVSEVIAYQSDRVIAETLAWIDRAFDGVPVPDEDHRTIYQAEAADDYDRCDQSRDHRGRWQDLPIEHLVDNQWALAHLDEQGIHYYVPAVMSFTLRGNRGWITESLGYQLEPSKPDLRDYQEERFSLFDREQRAAITAFALVELGGKAATAWLRVFEAERDGARSDWFSIYSPI